MGKAYSHGQISTHIPIGRKESATAVGGMVALR